MAAVTRREHATLPVRPAVGAPPGAARAEPARVGGRALWRAAAALGTGWLLCAGRGGAGQPAGGPAPGPSPGRAACDHGVWLDARVCGAPEPAPARSAAAVATLLAACWRPDEEPALAAYLDHAPPPDVAWRPASRPLWPGGAGGLATAAPAARLAAATALDSGEAARAAAVGALSAQQPERLDGLIGRLGERVQVHLMVAGSGAGRDREFVACPLVMAATLPADGNGTLALGDAGGTSGMALLRKFALKLAPCGAPLGVGFVAAAEVFAGVLGRRGTAVRLGDGELGRQLARLGARGVGSTGAIAFDGSLAGSTTGLGVSSTAGRLALASVDGRTNVTLRIYTAYGILAATAAGPRETQRPPADTLTLFGPLGGHDDPALAPGQIYAGPDSRSFVVPVALLDGVGGTLALAD